MHIGLYYNSTAFFQIHFPAFQKVDVGANTFGLNSRKSLLLITKNVVIKQEKSGTIILPRVLEHC